MKHSWTGAAAAGLTLLAAAGCFKANINIPGNGDGSGETGPSQIPGDGSWRDLPGQITLGAEKGVLLCAFDTLAYPARPVELTVRVRSGTTLAGIQAVEIGFYRDKERIASATTDDRGYATTEWTPPGRGDYPLAARIVEADDTRAEQAVGVEVPLLVAARAKDEPMAVIDLDHTVVDAGFHRVLLPLSPQPMAGSVDVVSELARPYTIVYLTHRPDLLCSKSKAWLDRHGFPQGPLLVSTLREALGSSGVYKSGRLASLREVYPQVRIGIGDKISDVQAYVDNGLKAVLIPHYDDEDAEEMRELAGAIDELEGRGRLHVVRDWREIRDVLFKGRSYPPGRFADELRRRARRIELQKRREEQEEDEDDDD